ncbi:MAG TPA: molybdate ABC transporter substrate-binding protein [Geobacterales bacterium]|nr:molybdate ABC transporter substrate-binding protein [Geobacterales bacterium]
MSIGTRLVASFSATLLASVLLVGQTASAQDGDANAPVIVFAAASLKNALDKVSANWEQESGQTVKTSYAASSTLAKQLEQDAPAQIFISADLDWMDYAAAKGLIKKESRSDLLGNKLVLIAPKDSSASVDLKLGAVLAKALGDGRLAIGNVDSVPAGKYGKAALGKLRLWDTVSNKLAQAESVRAALLLVSRGEAALGIVYQTDAAADPNVKIVATFPADSHPTIIYPVALTLKANAAAASFLDYIKSPKAAPAFEAQGFTVLNTEKRS